MRTEKKRFKVLVTPGIWFFAVSNAFPLDQDVEIELLTGESFPDQNITDDHRDFLFTSKNGSKIKRGHRTNALFRNGSHFVTFLLLCFVSVSCTTVPMSDLFSDILEPKNEPTLHTGTSAPKTNKISASGTLFKGFSGERHVGSGSFVSRRTPGGTGVTDAGNGTHELNLVNAPV